MLYYSLIYPFLTYGIQVWGLTYTYPTSLKPVTTLQKRVVRIMTFSDPETLLKSLRLLKFSDVIHLEILCFVYQWCHNLRPSCFLIILTQYLQFIHIIHVNHRLIICLLNLFHDTTQYGNRSLSYTGPFGILYLLMLRLKSSRFPVFVNISRIL